MHLLAPCRTARCADRWPKDIGRFDGFNRIPPDGKSSVQRGTGQKDKRNLQGERLLQRHF